MARISDMDNINLFTCGKSYDAFRMYDTTSTHVSDAFVVFDAFVVVECRACFSTISGRKLPDRHVTLSLVVGGLIPDTGIDGFFKITFRIAFGSKKIKNDNVADMVECIKTSDTTGRFEDVFRSYLEWWYGNRYIYHSGGLIDIESPADLHVTECYIDGVGTFGLVK